MHTEDPRGILCKKSLDCDVLMSCPLKCELARPVKLCRSFGDPDFKEPLHLVTATPDVIRERLLPGDEFVILASDGLVGARRTASVCGTQAVC